jgi:hypothetical protein
LEQEARLWALEVLTANLLVIVSGFFADREALIQSVFDRMADDARQQPLLADPARSNALAIELEASVRRLRELTDQQIARPDQG